MKKLVFGCTFIFLAIFVFGIGGSGQRGSLPDPSRFSDNSYARFEFTSSGTFTFEEYRWWRSEALGVAYQDEAYNVLRCSGTYVLDGDKITLSWSGTHEANYYTFNLFGSRRRGSTTNNSHSGTTTGTFTSQGSGFTIRGTNGGVFNFNGSYN